MGAVRFEGVDILDSLGQIMELHTQHYKDDFDMDKELIPKLALSGEPEDRRLLWLSRPCGTYTLREWEVYLEGSHANNVWKFYHEQTKDPVLAYALSIKDVQDGKVVGDIYPLEYGDTLISFLKSNNLYKSSLASVTLTEGAEQLKERLGAIMKFRKKSKVIIAITTIFTVAACVCFFVTGAYAAPSVANDMKTWANSEILNEILTEDGVYYIFCDGAGEDDKPLASVSAGNIMFVLVRKDSYTSVGPFDNMETLMEDVTEQCKYMKNLTEEEKGLIIETASRIVEANEEVWLGGITHKNEMTIYPKCIFPMNKGDIFHIKYNDSVSGTFNVGLIDENGEKLEAETTIWQEGDMASIEVEQDGSYYFYVEGFNDDAGWLNTTFKFIVSYE